MLIFFLINVKSMHIQLLLSANLHKYAHSLFAAPFLSVYFIFLLCFSHGAFLPFKIVFILYHLFHSQPLCCLAFTVDSKERISQCWETRFLTVNMTINFKCQSANEKRMIFRKQNISVASHQNSFCSCPSEEVQQMILLQIFSEF